MLRQSVLAFEQLHGTRCEDVRRFCNFVLSSQHSLSGGVTPPPATKEQPPAKRMRTSNTPPPPPPPPSTDENTSPEQTPQHMIDQREEKLLDEYRKRRNQLRRQQQGLHRPTPPTQKNGQSTPDYLNQHGRLYEEQYGTPLSAVVREQARPTSVTRMPPNSPNPTFNTPSTTKAEPPNDVTPEDEHLAVTTNLQSSFDEAAHASSAAQSDSIAEFINSQRKSIGLQPIPKEK